MADTPITQPSLPILSANLDSQKHPSSEIPTNLLPYDGEVLYYERIFDSYTSNKYLEYLLTKIPWKKDELVMFGKYITTERKVVWYGDKNYDYTFSHKTRVAKPWTPQLLEIKEKVEEITGVTYNSCLLNLYENGTQGLGWHHDNEEELALGASIASVSFGAERRFDLRHDKDKKTVSVVLEHGSLLVMRGTTQKHWKHQVPKTKKILQPRVNLTFRKMLE
jgi:alkylated DNA repair dioxygenase AlkB